MVTWYGSRYPVGTVEASGIATAVAEAFIKNLLCFIFPFSAIFSQLPDAPGRTPIDLFTLHLNSPSSILTTLPRV